MMKNLKMIVFIAVTIGVIAALHMFIYAPMKAEWNEVKQKTEGSIGTYNRLLQMTSGSGGAGLTNVSQLLQNELARLKTVVNQVEENFDQLAGEYDIVDQYDKSKPAEFYRTTLLDRIDQMKQLESSSQVTTINVSHEWGVEPSLTEGKFGTGLRAFDKHGRVYTNFRGTGQRNLNEAEGTVEFLVKPDWDPNDEEVKLKCLFLALGQRRVGSTEELHEISPGRMVSGPPPHVLESYIAVYKGEGPTLVYDMMNWSGDPQARRSTLTAYIQDWKPDTWYHVCVQWSDNRQALYINGSNKGVPQGPPPVSIRTAVDMEDIGFYGGGMGYGGMGMGGMGMGGFGMGRMGMGYGGMGGMGGSSRFGAMAGKTLTENIAIPDEISGIFVGTTEKSEHTAEAVIDELRISSNVRPTSSNALNTPVKSDPNSMLVDTFESELAPAVDLPILLEQLFNRQAIKNDRRNNPTVIAQKEWEYDIVRKALGIDMDVMATAEPTYNTIQKVATLNYILRNVQSSQYSLGKLFALFEMSEVEKRQIYMTAEFVRLAQALCTQAIDDKIIAVTRLNNRGESYNVTDEEIRNFLESQINGIYEKWFPGMEMGASYGGMGMGGMGMGGMGMYGMGMGGMGMGGMGMGGMGMGGMGMGMMGMLRSAGGFDWMYDPETGDPLPRDVLRQKMEQMQADVKKARQWTKAKNKGEIPIEIIEMYNVDARQSGQDYYIKRAAGLEFESDTDTYARYLHSLEFGKRIATINKLEIESLPEEKLKVITDVESHFVRPIQEGEVESAGGEEAEEVAQL